jgi:hypothetical protein
MVSSSASVIIVAPNKPVGLHLDAVQREMATRGAPTIRAWWDGEKWIALEGSHRLAAAHMLGLTPDIVARGLDDVLDDHDFQDVEQNATVQTLLAYLAKHCLGPHYQFPVGIPR